MGAGFSALAPGLNQVRAALYQADPRGRHVGQRGRTGNEALFQEGDELLLDLELILQKTHPALGGGVIEQARSELAANLPGSGGNIQTRRFRKLLGADDA